ncbi:MAG: hypothetical protein GY719_23105 [bacterium]|nr:hypothetical protein [bacterium]
MKGDFTRSTFDPTKGYTSVRMQQGRVQLDADWNEQIDIQDHLRRMMLGDVLGASGVPREQPDSFEIYFQGGQLRARPGRIWVDGMPCESGGNPLMDAAPATGTWLAYLDVWQSHVTAIEDPDIRETALGGPDSSTRTRTHCRVRFAQVAPGTTCLDVADWTDPLDTTGTMAAQFQAAGVGSSDPCEVPADAGYAGLENHLYRVEVHDGGEILPNGNVGPAGSPTFKWSRDNGSITAEWLASSSRQVTIRNPRQDSVRGFQDPPFWIEMSDDITVIDDQLGRVAEVKSYSESSTGEAVLELDGDEDEAPAPNSSSHPKVRRWDAELENVATGKWIDLEYGIQIQFQPGVYRSGDYWLIPARAFIGDYSGGIEWPEGDGNVPAEVPPHGGERRAAKLAVVELNNTVPTSIEDCRQVFSPLAEQVTFTLAGGDSQAGHPGETLPCPLQVAVLQGKHPIAGARVRFTALSDGGAVDGVPEVEAVTNADGIAEVSWKLPAVITPFIGAGRQCLTVKARLLGPGGTDAVAPITFSADLRVASEVAFTPAPECDALQGYNDVESAINQMCLANGGGKRAIGEFSFADPADGQPKTIPLTFLPKYVWAVVAASAAMPAVSGAEVTGYAELGADGTITQRSMHRACIGYGGTDNRYYSFHRDFSGSATYAFRPHLAHMRFHRPDASPAKYEYFVLDVTSFDDTGLTLTVTRFKKSSNYDTISTYLNGYLVIFG